MPEPRVEVSYLTRNLGWQADYVLRLSADGARGDLQGWVTLDNQSGASFEARSSPWSRATCSGAALRP